MNKLRPTEFTYTCEDGHQYAVRTSIYADRVHITHCGPMGGARDAFELPRHILAAALDYAVSGPTVEEWECEHCQQTNDTAVCAVCGALVDGEAPREQRDAFYQENQKAGAL